MDSESPWGVDGSDGQPLRRGRSNFFCEVMMPTGPDAWYVGCASATYLLCTLMIRIASRALLEADKCVCRWEF